MQLGNMQDIGGCRAVIGSLEELRRVQRRVRKKRPPLDVFDDVASPRPSGYRGVRIIVQYDDRRIEAQLRTPVMHDWAIAVERLGGRLQEDLKSGGGPQEVLDLLGVISEAMELEERGMVVDDGRTARIDDLRAQASPWIDRKAR